MLLDGQIGGQGFEGRVGRETELGEVDIERVELGVVRKGDDLVWE